MDLGRRDYMKAIAGGTVAGLTLSRADDFSDQNWAFLDKVDTRNLRMFDNAADFLFGDTDVHDWAYNQEHAIKGVNAFLGSLVGANKFAEPQKYCPGDAVVSTAEDGITANFTSEGRMSTMMFPHTGFTHQLPYYTQGDEDFLLEAKQHEGGFAGISDGEDVTWLWEDEFEPVDSSERDISYRDDTGLLEISYGGDELEVEETTYVLPETETVVRDFVLENISEGIQEGSFLYHTQANVNDNQQNYGIWASNKNKLEAGEELFWNDEEGPFEMMIYTDADVEESSVTDTGPKVRDEEEYERRIDELKEEILEQMAEAGADIIAGEVPSIDGTHSLWDKAVQEANIDEIVDSEKDSVEGKYLSGLLETDYSLEPGEKAEISFFITGGEETEKINADKTAEERQQEAESYWRDRMEQLTVPDEMASDEIFTNSVVAKSMLNDPETGAKVASPNLQPSYSFSWPRDGAISAVTDAKIGFEEEAKKYLTDFLPSVIEDDGRFRQCYDAAGDFSGIFEVENDQQPIYLWAVDEVHEATEDREFLESAWPAVKSAADYTIDSIADNDLPAATPDYREEPTDIRQSLWTSSWTYTGLKAAAEIAGKQGRDKLSEKYSDAAERVGEATREIFVEEDQQDLGTENIEEYFNTLDWKGLKNDANRLMGYMVEPATWAEDYGVTDVLTRDWDEMADKDVNWFPAALCHTAAMYDQGMDQMADESFEQLLEEGVMESGYIAERLRDGEHIDASPLGWAQDAYIDAELSKY